MLRNGYLLAMVGVALAGCGGGGSSNGGDTGTLTPTGPLLRDAATDGTPVVSPTGVSLTGSTSRITFPASDSIAVEISSGALNNVLVFEPGDVLVAADSGVIFFANNNNRDGALVAMPADSTLDYTAYGLWINGASANLASVNGPFGVDDAGVGHFGILTTPADMPATGSASYFGAAVGLVADGNQVQDLLNGTVQATADFAAGDIDIAMQLNGSTGGAFANLTANGVAIDASASSFGSGAGGAALDTGHVGRVDGNFYGPAAAEIGGQFDLSDGSTRVIGAFGGRQ